MMVACLLPDKGSLGVLRRSLMPFGSPESLPTRSVLMANLTLLLLLLLSSLLRPLRKNVQPAPTSLIAPTSARRVLLRAATVSLSCICQVPNQQELFYAAVYLTQHCPSPCARSRGLLSIISLFSFCSTAKRDLR